jgi:uncharacterized protein GlcG (DUF336 family)
MHRRAFREVRSRPSSRRQLPVARLSLEELEGRTLLDAAANAAFVGKAYLDLLHRPVDPTGLAFFSSMLNQGTANRLQVAVAIQGSAEYQQSLLNGIYMNLLHRPIDPSGLAAFSAALANGVSVEQVKSFVAGSAEYFQARGGSTNDGFLDALYQDAFVRAVDPAGRATFDQQLAAGVSRTQVAFEVFSSPEFQKDLIQAFYQQFLHRAPDAGGLATFENIVGFGARDEQAIGLFLASAEYAPGETLAPVAGATLSASDVQRDLTAAASASASTDGIIAIVDRGGRVLGVQVEAGVSPTIRNDPVLLTFAVDGAIAEARTGAFFANDQAPLTSRTVRFISQTTITQREVDSNPNILDPNSTLRGPGFVAPVGIAGHFPPGVPFTPQVDLFDIEASNRDSIIHPGPDGVKGSVNDIQLPNRFNVPDAFIPASIPFNERLQPPESYGFLSGIDPTAQARGIGTLPGGLPIYGKDASGMSHVVGGIGVFFPGATGFASAENSSLSTTFNPALRDRSLEAEFMAFMAVGGTIPANINLPLTLVGITLDTIGPGGPQGIANLLQFGSTLGTRTPSGDVNLPVDRTGDQFLPGTPVPDGWLVTPHAGGGLSAADVVQIINQGIAQANATRAAIRLPESQTTRMVFAVSDPAGNLLGLYRMPDATVFSLDVAVAKSRNVVYYANPALLQPIDQTPGVAPGVAFSNRTFRYLALPHFPEGIDAAPPGPFSILNDGGTNPQNGLQVGPPLPASAFQSVQGHDAFFPGTNFHDPINLANQNGIILFPGAVPLYKGGLVGGLGVSGDGVDQDDVVTFGGSQGFLPGSILTADQFFVNGVRLPYQKFDRNPEG